MYSTTFSKRLVWYTVDMYNLPRGYLSNSSMELWRQNKERFRAKYYGDGQDDPVTPYMRFGKDIAELLEDKKAVKKHQVLKKLPKYDTPEYAIEVEIDGVPIKGFIDSFCTKKHRILEYKTGIRNPKGNPPWDQVKVKKHNQLLLYSLCIKEKLGMVHPTLHLVWLETAWREEITETYFNDKVFTKREPVLYLTGVMEKFARKIELWEHDWMRKEIVRIATEISEDYTRYVHNSVAKTVN